MRRLSLDKFIINWTDYRRFLRRLRVGQGSEDNKSGTWGGEGYGVFAADEMGVDTIRSRCYLRPDYKVGMDF